MKKFKVGDVVTSELGEGLVIYYLQCKDYPVQVRFMGVNRVESYSNEGRLDEDAPITLFHGKGKVNVTFTPEPEPVYEYQWLIEKGDEIICITEWHKTIDEVFKKYSSLYTHAVFSVHRLDECKRQVGEIK